MRLRFRCEVGLFVWVLLLAAVGCAHVEEAHFYGTVTAIDRGCEADGLCTITVDGQVIPFGQGWSRSSWGRIVGAPARADAAVGMAAEVLARKVDGRALHLPDSYTLEGSSRYFVRLFRQDAGTPARD
jgi:hypothetical protein